MFRQAEKITWAGIWSGRISTQIVLNRDDGGLSYFRSPSEWYFLIRCRTLP